jgi:hypothetical protein
MKLKKWLKWLKKDFKSASAWYYKKIPKYTSESIKEIWKEKK